MPRVVAGCTAAALFSAAREASDVPDLDAEPPGSTHNRRAQGTVCFLLVLFIATACAME
jgi:hypothetical protein